MSIRLLFLDYYTKFKSVYSLIIVIMLPSGQIRRNMPTTAFFLAKNFYFYCQQDRFRVLLISKTGFVC